MENGEEPSFKLDLTSPPQTLPVKRVESEENLKNSLDPDAMPSAKSSRKTLRKVGTQQLEDEPQTIERIKEMRDSYQNGLQTDVKRVKERISGIISPVDISGSPRNSPRSSARNSPKNSKVKEADRRDSIRELFIESTKENFKKSATFREANSATKQESNTSTAKKLG
jgi:hypothetical protein